MSECLVQLDLNELISQNFTSPPTSPSFLDKRYPIHMSVIVSSAKVLGNAFMSSPLMNYCFSESSDEEREIQLTKVYECCVFAASLYGGIVHAPNNEGALAFRVPVVSLNRLTSQEEEYEPYIMKHAGDRMGLIWVVGVASAFQGRGHCRYMMEQAIATMTACGMNEFWLCTDKEVNVTIYSKLGFQTMEENTIQSSGIKFWVMRRLA